MEKIQVVIGMVGAGRATELHMEAYERVKDIQPRYKAILAKHVENAKKAKEKYGFEYAVSCFEDMLKDPEIQVIDICSPPYTHAEMIIQALEAGKHVICEKPLTGYFGMPDDEEPIGKNVDKRKMYQESNFDGKKKDPRVIISISGKLILNLNSVPHLKQHEIVNEIKKRYEDPNGSLFEVMNALGLKRQPFRIFNFDRESIESILETIAE